MAGQLYVLAAVVALACLFVLLRKKTGGAGRLTPLAGVAFGFVIAGLVFGEHPMLSYGLIGAGVALAVVDILRRSRHRAA